MIEHQPEQSSEGTGASAGSRRDFLATSAALAAAGLTMGLPGLAQGQGRGQSVDLNRLAREMMPTCVRFKINHEGSPAQGSGTLVETPEFFKELLAPDEVLAISAGHVFHDMNDLTTIQADLFKGFDSRLNPTGHHEVEARCIGYRSAAEDGQPPDIAIIAVKLPEGVTNVKKVKLGPADHTYEFGDQGITIGCPGGDDPIWLNSRVLNYAEPTETHGANVTTIASPQGGHSGGGMFSPDGELIGICSGNRDVPRGTIDFIVPNMKEVIISPFRFEPEENQIVVSSNYEAEQYRKRMTPDWAEFSTGRGSFATVPEVHEFMHKLVKDYETAKHGLSQLEKDHQRLKSNLDSQQGSLSASAYTSLQEALGRVSDTAIETAKKRVSKYRPLE